ncbi:type II secretion system minor pseudopilin GspH [Colwellia sp. MB02u-18]|uniref:type II secretion system minor pseudopilin GspH n=1 Tax=unclassified Colwellia TaxID=196834 RepID=UPI0015F390FE|nr:MULTISPECIES: type II secretion system minor pseudopilin GspH [unclassified Colwellia]MBA6223456.1 type II secretion system minor pseudopilin GspH [Colwellia sp. MB3u-45]MBA6267981.1 type II secretion system minor pseudopilin GspH [Colwellia sp. MB3u-43]MBA6321640.1 type II secretion system minor pseudopilin GspH [Colwellia sp. MB02u-19]MBA6325361.1 type II secretion system minor pseudopilin GspH [Colwellia sp. MB02u-18]MBA6330028.1 type II secretion system minor pseudopilin GspH [Colwellia
MKLKNGHLPKDKHRQQGFTLIEVMLVIVLIGVMVSAVQFTFSGNKAEQLLEQNSIRFAGVFDAAAEYGLLNNIELGLFVEKNTYQFLGYDGVSWSPIASNPMFEVFTLPEGIEITLQLDDLPIEEPLLFDSSLLINEDQDDNFTEEEKKKTIPQVYMLSGGDITPFSLTFSLAEFAIDGDENISFKVSGIYTTPLTIEGPLVNANSR